MNILPMLARLEYALGRTDLTEQMVLVPQTHSRMQSTTKCKEVNFVVGYNGSPRSQTALDLTLWIAHQTRLATSYQVTVQVVYVVNLQDACQIRPFDRKSGKKRRAAQRKAALVGSASGGSGRSASVGTLDSAIAPSSVPQPCQLDQFEQADQILWQARHLAEEWRGSLKTHLRFGDVATELRQVVETECASVLMLGCESTDDTLVRQLAIDIPCPVLGIPPAL